jgi:hypothetical protein
VVAAVVVVAAAVPGVQHGRSSCATGVLLLRTMRLST